MKSIIKLFSILTLFVVISGNLISQPIYEKKNQKIVENKISQLNVLLDDVCKLDFSKGQLTIDFFKDGSLYRQDKIYFETLDPVDIGYSMEEKSFIIRCRQDLTGILKKFKDGCIDRIFVDKKIRRMYGRTNIDIPYDKEKVEEIKVLFQDLIKMAEM